MLKLKKVKQSSWVCNVVGRVSAEWVVAGHEDISVREYGLGWHAAREGKKLVNGAASRKDCLEILETKLFSE